MGAHGETCAGARSDRDPTPPRPDKPARDDWSPRGHVPSFLSTRRTPTGPRAQRTKREKKKLPRASIGFEASAGTSVLPSRVMPCPGRSAKIEVLATEAPWAAGPGDRLCSSIRPSGAPKCSYSTLSEPPPIILRHEVVLFLSPLCDSHSKHVEKTHVREVKAGTKKNAPRCVSNRRAWQVW